MGAGDALNFWGLVVIVLPGVMTGEWAVRYPEKAVCAMRGSTVVISCEYHYPQSFRVETVMWCHNTCTHYSYICHSNNENITAQYAGRAECLGDKVKNGTLQIKDIKGTDAGEYRFRFTTNETTGKWSGHPGVTLKVNDAAWTIDYPEKSLCAVRGSTVVIQCQYNYPKSYQEDSMMWSHNTEDCAGKSHVYNSNHIHISAQYADRAKILGNKEKNCTLMINNITESDAGVYRFSFTANGCEQCGQPGVALHVFELKVVMTSSRGYGILTEGDSVTLTCGTENCFLNQSEFTWFKDNQSITGTQSTLNFNPVSFNHSGKYSCALKGYRGTESNTILLHIQSKGYPITVMVLLLGILLAVLAIIIFIIRRKRDSLNVAIDRGDETQTKSQRQEVSSQVEDVCYASVQFNTKQPGRQCDVSKLKNRDDEVVYAAVREPANCS
ncbi:B-cell receptor CD22-like isoform X2 [Brienomyrus brachyistius]|uniref:B-cell receptor CD22-like isoform X2 n=1 Tax=Brienomyrus brachyistius TaxID=42636 RepID=UPI0020B20E0E|nr:B-cell receptor CD22-like isoform X2 [Brienomyrus brachyistius]